MRELSGVEIVDKLGIENSTNVLDPTLLLSGEDWRKISSRKFTKDRYILIYNLNRNPRIDAYAKELSIKTGLEVRYLSYQLHEFYKNGKMFCNPPVEDFLALIDGADYVITDSFHATAFSLNFNKEFVIVYPGKYSTRLQSILEILGLTNRVAKNERDLSIVESKIDYNRVNEILAAERKRSLLWLSNALSGVKMKTVCELNMCNGCMACVEKCHRNAITIKDDLKYYNALIDTKKCVDCGLCTKVCPRENDNDMSKPKWWYQGWADSEIREHASSGGAASAIIRAFIKHGGYVASCLFDSGKFVFEVTNEMAVARKFAGSKYVKSNPEKFTEKFNHY